MGDWNTVPVLAQWEARHESMLWMNDQLQNSASSYSIWLCSPPVALLSPFQVSHQNSSSNNNNNACVLSHFSRV